MEKKRGKISLTQLGKLFPDNKTAEQWFIDNRWQGNVKCPFCKQCNVTERKTAKRSWRCKDCRKDFSTRTKTVMHGSNLDFKTWVWAIHFITTSAKGIASTKLASDLGITQKVAWHLSMRIREAHKTQSVLTNTVEGDETYIGSMESAEHADKKLYAEHDTAGKQYELQNIYNTMQTSVLND